VTLNRYFWKPPFEFLPPLPCPHCSSGTLAVIKETLNSRETAESKSAHHKEDWIPEVDIENRFSALMECRRCHDVVAICGTMGMGRNDYVDDEGEWHHELEDVFIPFYFHKAPPVIRLSPKCPEPVREEIVRSFPLYWCDLRARANRIRSAIELVLDERGIPAETTGKNGKLRRIWLHDRIEEFAKSNEECSRLLLPLKIVGNLGSHGDSKVQLSKDDLLDAYEIFGFVAEQIYVNEAARMAKLAEELKQRLSKKSSK
jgi:hypothetical protein